MTERLCANCHWRDEQSCEAPQNIVIQPGSRMVDGKPREMRTHRWLTLDYARWGGWLGARLIRSCGREGRWWEQNR